MVSAWHEMVSLVSVVCDGESELVVSVMVSLS